MDTQNKVEEKNPWLGLQAYTEDKTLYGRDDDIRALTQRVLSDNSLVLYGRSGIGKSSIINAGIIPSVRRNGIISISIRLDHQKDSSSYQSQIAESLKANGVIIKQHSQPSKHQLLWEFFHRNVFLNEKGERVKILLIFDQFEEIFTLQSNAIQKKHFFNEMADVLNDIMPGALHKEIEEVKTFAEIKESTSKESTDSDDFGLDDLDLDFTIVEKPNEFVDDNEFHLVFTLREDFLSEFEYYTSTIPVLKQHRYGLRPLNEEQAAEIIQKPRAGLVSKDVAKLIIEKVTQRTDFDLDGVPEIEVDSAVLSLYLKSLYDSKTEDTITAALVEQKGGSIITSFYNECITGLNNAIIERLEDLLLNDEGRRDIKSLSILYKELGKEVVNDLIDKKLLRQFAYGGDYRVEFIHDILCKVVKDRKDQREQLRKQEEEALRQEEERKKLLRQQRRERNRMLLLLAIAASVIVLIIAWLTCDWFLHEREFKSYYADFTRKNGWPVGVGEELSEGEATKLTTYYCLIKYGYRAENNIEVQISPDRNLAPHNMRVPLVAVDDTTDVNAREFASLLRNTRRITFSKGEGNRVAKETAFDSKGKVLYTTNYYGEGETRWLTYNNANGSPIKVRGESDRMRIVTDTLGMDVEYMFFDALGIPCKNDMGDYGIAMQYDDKHRISELRHLNAFRSVKYTERRTYKNELSYRVDYDRSPFAYNAVEVKMDKKGNVVERHYIYQNNENKPVFETIDYSSEGLMVKRQWLNGNHESLKTDGVVLVSYLYKKGTKELCGEFRINSRKDTLYKYELTSTPERCDSIVHDKINNKYVHKRSLFTKGQLTEVAFFAEDGSAVYNADEEYHRMELKTVSEKDGGYIIYRTYYTEKNELYKNDVTRSESHYDSMGNRILYRTYDYLGNIIKSMAYEYENGVEKVRYAVGVHGDPIRCPKWESEGLCYYKLYSVRDFTDKLAQLYAVGENSEESLLYGASTYKPDTINTKHIGCDWLFYTVRLTKPYIPENHNISLSYIHLLKKDGAADKAGLKDGDILIEGALLSGNRITVKRYNKVTRKTEVVKVQLPNVAALDAEVYPVYFTRKEYESLWK